MRLECGFLLSRGGGGIEEDCFCAFFADASDLAMIRVEVNRREGDRGKEGRERGRENKGESLSSGGDMFDRKTESGCHVKEIKMQ